jgi:cephalosporin hydroxylase
MNTVEIIERAIIAAGSDHLGVFGGDHEGGACVQQIPDEFARFVALVLQGEPVLSYLEIGSAAGGTAYLVHHLLRPAKMVLVDDDGHPRHLDRSRVLDGIERQEIIGRSQDPEIVERARRWAPYDLILVDGDHNYRACREDADNCIPMLSMGGLIAFHDSALAGWGACQVVGELFSDPRLAFVDELKSKAQDPLGLALFRRVAE